MNMSGNQNVTMKAMLMSVFANIILSLTLVPSLGGLGAAVSTAASLFIWNSTLWFLVRKKIGVNSGFWGGNKPPC
jgi:O-antigen/teichoic acid export membrane protein